MFEVIAETKANALRCRELTYHANAERAERKARAEKLGGEVYKSFIVSTGHVDGNEIHTILTSGVVVIANLSKQVIITWLLARPAQIKRYGIYDKEIIENAERNQRNGLNY